MPDIANWLQVSPMYGTLLRHPFLCLALTAAMLISALMVGHGEAKPASEWVWLDIVGEGGTAILIFSWLVWVARSRPGGRVTRSLLAGLISVFLAMWTDTLDEFFRLAEQVQWDHWLESALMPLGLLLLTFGIYHWHQEQMLLNVQMRKRERLFREHRHFDALLPLTGAGYLRRQLQRELTAKAPANFALLVLDLKQFTNVNREHGFAEGDQVLLAISQLLLLNLRQGDLLCRLAGDRFVALLPATSAETASEMAADLGGAVHAFAYRTARGDRLQLAAVTWVVLPTSDDSVEHVLQRLGEVPRTAAVPAATVSAQTAFA